MNQPAYKLFFNLIVFGFSLFTGILVFLLTAILLDIVLPKGMSGYAIFLVPVIAIVISNRYMKPVFSLHTKRHSMRYRPPAKNASNDNLLFGFPFVPAVHINTINPKANKKRQTDDEGNRNESSPPNKTNNYDPLADPFNRSSPHYDSMDPADLSSMSYDPHFDPLRND